jgi:hypothetical protein
MVLPSSTLIPSVVAVVGAKVRKNPPLLRDRPLARELCGNGLISTSTSSTIVRTHTTTFEQIRLTYVSLEECILSI